MGGENAAQKAYEQTIEDTNNEVDSSLTAIANLEKTKAERNKERLFTESQIADSIAELDRLGKYNIALHQECDYLLKNFDTRQAARSEEVEALQQAKQILSGASL